jgi:hypothetical protein
MFGGTASAFGTAIIRPKLAPPPIVKGNMIVLGMIAPTPRTPTTNPAACENDATL